MKSPIQKSELHSAEFFACEIEWVLRESIFFLDMFYCLDFFLNNIYIDFILQKNNINF